MLAVAVSQASSPSGSRADALGTLNFTFEDGSTSSTGFVVGGWWSGNPFNGPIQTSVILVSLQFFA
jgi:hypothetical protein